MFLAALGTLHSGGVVIDLRRTGIVLGGLRARIPLSPEIVSDALTILAGRFGLVVAWIIVITEGLPPLAVGALLLRGVRSVCPFIITVDEWLDGILILLMTILNLLVKVGYIPALIPGLITPEKSQAYLSAWTHSITIRHVL